MRKATLGFTVALVIMTASAMAQARTTGPSIQKATPTLARTATNETPSQVKKDPTVLEKKISTASPDEPDEHFRKARESFLRKDVKAAAAEIRKGAVLLKLKAGHAPEEAKEALAASSRELETLARALEQGTVASTQDLRRAFARADRALAEQRYQRAAESWSKKEIKNAGHELKAAANHVKMTVAWAGHKLEATTAALVKEARATAAKLEQATGSTTDEFGKGLHGVDNAIEKLGKQIEPAKT
jgi:hypothetical protein